MQWIILEQENIEEKTNTLKTHWSFLGDCESTFPLYLIFFHF